MNFRADGIELFAFLKRLRHLGAMNILAGTL